MTSYDQELYFRAHEYLWKLIQSTPNSTRQLEGRIHPTVPRQDEEYKLPNLRSCSDWIAYLTLILLTNQKNDYAIAKVLIHCNNLAKRYKYEGEWSFWYQLNLHFGTFESQNEKKEETIYSLPDYFIFLKTRYHEDEIFGTILRRSFQLVGCIKIKKAFSSVTDERVVKYPQRHRGYRDKGSTAPVGSKEFREANRLPASPVWPEADYLSQIEVWGSLPPKPE